MTIPQKKIEPGSGNTPPRRCVACEKPLPDHAQFCPYCQEPVAGSKPQTTPRFCPGCGREAASDFQYCPACTVEIPDTITPWHKRVDQAKEEELEADLYICHQDKKVMLYYQDPLVQQELQVRAIRRAEYAGSLMTAPEWFDVLYEITDDYNSAFVVYGLLSGNYPTIVCPYAPYNAIPLTKKVMLLSLIAQAMEKGYLLPDSADPSPVVLGRYAPIVLQYYKRAKHITDEELTSLRFRFHLGKLECWLAGKQADDYASLSPESFYTLRTLDRMYGALRNGVLRSKKEKPAESSVVLSCGACQLAMGHGIYSDRRYCPHCHGGGKLNVIQPPAYKQAQQSGLVVVERTCPHCHNTIASDQRICGICGGMVGEQGDHSAFSAPKLISSRGLYCGKCGKQVQRPDAKHCEACGWRFGVIYRQEIVKGWNEPHVYTHCPSCGETAYYIGENPTYCEHCGSSLKVPPGTPGDLAYCHACGYAVHATAQQHCTSCGTKLSPRSARIQEPALPSWQPSRIVEGSVVRPSFPASPAAGSSRYQQLYYPCPCPKKANLCRPDATWCIQCNRTLAWDNQYAQKLPAVRPRSPRRKG